MTFLTIYKIIDIFICSVSNNEDLKNKGYKLFYMDNYTIKKKIMKEHTYINNSNNKCDLCLEKNINIILNCHKNHNGCMECMIEWCKKDNSCPFCREKIIEIIK